MITEWQMGRELALIGIQDALRRMHEDEKQAKLFKDLLLNHIEEQKDKRQPVKITAAEGFIAGWRAAKGGGV